MPIQSIAKTVALAATPEALGASTQKFSSVMFVAYKGTAETANTGDVYVQVPALEADGTEGSLVSVLKLTPGASSPVITKDLGLGKLSADKFTVKVATNGDGVIAIVAS